MSSTLAEHHLVHLYRLERRSSTFTGEGPWAGGWRETLALDIQCSGPDVRPCGDSYGDFYDQIHNVHMTCIDMYITPLPSFRKPC